jgi:hypothetical protein
MNRFYVAAGEVGGVEHENPPDAGDVHRRDQPGVMDLASEHPVALGAFQPSDLRISRQSCHTGTTAFPALRALASGIRHSPIPRKYSLPNLSDC